MDRRKGEEEDFKRRMLEKDCKRSADRRPLAWLASAGIHPPAGFFSMLTRLLLLSFILVFSGFADSFY